MSVVWGAGLTLKIDIVEAHYLLHTPVPAPPCTTCTAVSTSQDSCKLGAVLVLPMFTANHSLLRYHCKSLSADDPVPSKICLFDAIRLCQKVCIQQI